MDCIVATAELEIDGNVVHADIGYRAHCSAGNKEEDWLFLKEQVHGHQASLNRSQDIETLLNGEEDPQNTRYNKQRDDLPRIPGIQGPAKVDGHDQGYECAHTEDSADPVKRGEFLPGSLSRGRVVGWDNEQVRGKENGAEEEIDVEGPTPGIEFEGTANYRAKNSS